MAYIVIHLCAFTYFLKGYAHCRRPLAGRVGRLLPPAGLESRCQLVWTVALSWHGRGSHLVQTVASQLVDLIASSWKRSLAAIWH